MPQDPVPQDPEDRRQRRRILVTGGAGYVGSHACVALLEAGYDILVVDNLSNSSVIALDRVKEITGLDFPVIIGDIADTDILAQVFDGQAINAVMHSPKPDPLRWLARQFYLSADLKNSCHQKRVAAPPYAADLKCRATPGG